jgi:hypothetical protein
MKSSFIDTWASTAAGALSLTENSLYTVDAWKLFLDQLAPDVSVFFRHETVSVFISQA